MSEQSDTALSPAEQLRQKGQHAHHAIIAAKKHDMRGTNLWLSAGLTLLECKKEVPHGQWLNWLTNVAKISQQSAHKAMQIASASDPHKAVEDERERVKDAVRAHRDRARSPLRNGDLNRSAPVPHARPKRPSKVLSIDHARAHKAIDTLTPEQVKAVLKFIGELT